MFAFDNFEIGALYLIQDFMRTPKLTDFLESMTDLGNAGFIWLALAIVLICTKKYRKVGYATFLSLAMNLILTNGILKHIFKRARPFDTYPDLQPLIHEPTDWSFPSGHSSASFAAAFVLYHYLPKKFSIPALILATLIAVSRLYLGVHYPSDVIGGAAIGYLTAWASEKFMTYTEKKTGAKSQNLAHKKKAESA